MKMTLCRTYDGVYFVDNSIDKDFDGDVTSVTVTKQTYDKLAKIIQEYINTQETLDQMWEIYYDPTIK